MHEQGFFYLTNYGISEEEITRQVNIGHTVLSETPQEEKERLRAQMQEEGNYKGFKLKGYYLGAGGTPDRIEQWNWYVDASSIKPLKPTLIFSLCFL